MCNTVKDRDSFSLRVPCPNCGKELFMFRDPLSGSPDSIFLAPADAITYYKFDTDKEERE